MPRPAPLTATSAYKLPNYLVEQQELTPRTSRLRFSLEYGSHDEMGLLPGPLQLQPLLQSSSAFEFRKKETLDFVDDSDELEQPSKRGLLLLKYLPLGLCTVLAFVLLVSALVSYERPGVLDYYLSLNLTSNSTKIGNLIIDYSNRTSFPLKPLEYAEECWKHFRTAPPYHGDYWSIPANGFADALHPPPKSNSNQCNSTITYLLDGETVGLTAELAIMAQAAAFARERGSTFLVIDRHWNRGRWDGYFEPVENGQPGPEPGCHPPPPEELVACPRLARHWVITYQTAKFHLGHTFSEAYEDAHARGINRQRPIYERSRRSFLGAIRPNKHIRSLIAIARAELSGLNPTSGSSYVAVHIRRGDSGSQAWSYHGKQVPISEYVQTVQTLQQNNSSPFPIYIGSDSSSAIESLTKALETKQFVTLRTSSNPTLRSLAYPSSQPNGYLQSDWTSSGVAFQKWSTNERRRYMEGMLVDLALLSGLWNDDIGDHDSGTLKLTRLSKVICTIMSTICRVMALGLGFDHAFGDEKGLDWVEIDSKGGVEPVWEAFALSFAR
ncbi:uncharacterized protein EI90DRAFT_3015599 [Cantharellus anzutake]|uniref:uncharacterized protein n=1 Tax=Cantharellus anzutake TaxID=1750568 RepID=UPI0019071D39|nr:uncharacterized protein EI90DRAFT_3015599 [Cantharellus anzutake]KAF8333171.1 hypothetical protein EI90DRAFT_3015599 [Cantharellus anzutake]